MSLTITDSNGKGIHSLNFDSWGARRDGDTWNSLTDAQRIAALKIDVGNIFTQPITTRGFTGHDKFAGANLESFSSPEGLFPGMEIADAG